MSTKRLSSYDELAYIPASLEVVDNVTIGKALVVAGTTISPTSLAAEKAASIGITIDGGASAPTSGSKGFLVIPYAGTITKWYLTANASGNAVIDLKRGGNSIIGGSGNKPTLSGAQRANAAVASWTSTEIAANDEIEFYLDSAATVTRLNLSVYITKA
jgi:hypothetical protein